MYRHFQPIRFYIHSFACLILRMYNAIKGLFKFCDFIMILCIYIHIYFNIFPPTLITQFLSMFLYLHNFMLELFMNIFFSFHSNSTFFSTTLQTAFNFLKFILIAACAHSASILCVYIIIQVEAERKEEKEKEFKERLRKYHNSFRVQMRSLIILHK